MNYGNMNDCISISKQEAERCYAAAAAPNERDTPLLDVEYNRLAQSAMELDQSVQWLLQRIQPVCQPANSAQSKETTSRVADSPASEVRMKLQKIRELVEGTSRRISEVRFSIEI
jgi:hypothetical protein